MKKYIFISLLFILSIHAFSQMTFEKGYIIDNTGKKNICFIKNMDWKSNPTTIKYKNIGSDDIEIATIDNIREFGVNHLFKYKKFTVQIDRSSENADKLSVNRNPKFSLETLFLKALVEGKASLYEYIDKRLKRYFYSLDNQKLEQLIYKSYISQRTDLVRKNERYKQQLHNALQCSDIDIKNINKLSYSRNDLVGIFTTYNRCKNSDYTSFVTKERKKSIHLSPRLGLRSSSLSMTNNQTNPPNINFDSQLSFRAGLEFEFILPYNKNKWGIIIEPTYQHFEAEKVIAVDYLVGGELINKVDYTSIEVPVGIRYYMFLDKDSKLFVNASFIFDFDSNSTIESNKTDGSNFKTYDIQTRNNLAFGLGYNYHKLSFELRAQTPREVLGNYVFWSSDFSSLSAILGFQVF